MHATTDVSAAACRGRLRLVQHGAIIVLIGLLSGFGMVFAILGAVHVWPVTIPYGGGIPGSEHGWRVAHVAGINAQTLICARMNKRVSATYMD
jgi:hypothetical protein